MVPRVLEITTVLQPVCNDVKIGPACTHENKEKSYTSKVEKLKRSK